MQRFFLAVIFLATPAFAWAQNITITSFNQSKKHLLNVFSHDPVTLYSGCRYVDKKIDYSSCAYKPAKSGPRADRIEWEHVVPAEAFGRSFPAWRNGHPDCIDRRGRAFRGRQCAAKVDLTYRRVESDMYNLFPEIGELNARRSNFTMAPVAESGDAVDTGSGKIAGRSFEPPDEVKGVVARVHLYMADAYPQLRLLSPQRRALYEVWSSAHPADGRECARVVRIAAAQGNDNQVVSRQCSAQN